MTREEEMRKKYRSPWLEDDAELERVAIAAVVGGGFDDILVEDAERAKDRERELRDEGRWRRAAAKQRIEELFDARLGDVISEAFWNAWGTRKWALKPRSGR